MRLLSISVCLLAAATGTAAQEPLTVAEARMSGARGEYDPLLRFDVAGRRWHDVNTSLFSGAPAEVAASNSSVGSSFSISQLFKPGATASLWTSISRNGTNNNLILFQPACLTSLGVDLRQPLLRNRAIDPARAALRATALDRDRSGAAVDRQLLATVAEVEAAYWTPTGSRRLSVRRPPAARRSPRGNLRDRAPRRIVWFAAAHRADARDVFVSLARQAAAAPEKVSS